MANSTMVFETVFTEGVAHLSYLIGDRATGKVAVIDPRRDVDIYIELANQHKLSITHVLETHIHADFVSGTRELCDRTGTAKAMLSAEGGAKYGFECDNLKDGDKIDLGRVILTAIHTPGHTPEHMSYLAAEAHLVPADLGATPDRSAHCARSIYDAVKVKRTVESGL